jgi:hypothetical protein
MHHWLMHNWCPVAEKISMSETHSNELNRGLNGGTTRQAIALLLRSPALNLPLAQLDPADRAGKGRHKRKKKS